MIYKSFKNLLFELKEAKSYEDKAKVFHEYFYNDKDFYRAAFKIEGQNAFKDYVLESLEPITRYFLQGSEIRGDDEEFFLEFVGDAFLASIMRWLRGGMKYTPEEFVSKLHSMGLGLAEQVLKDEE